MRYPLMVTLLASLEGLILLWVPNIWNAALFGFCCGCACCSFIHWRTFRLLKQR